MIYIVIILAIIMNAVTYILSDLEMDIWFSVASDIKELLIAVGVYLICPMYKFRMKILSCIYLIITASFSSYNMFVYADIIPSGTPNYISIGTLVVLLVLFSISLMTKWDNLPNDDIHHGFLYEIVGKPRGNLQFFGFVISGGKGGTWALTDGVRCWYFSKETGRRVEENLDPKYTIGKKVVRVGKMTPDILNKIRAGNGRKWSIFNNCLTSFGIGI